MPAVILPATYVQQVAAAGGIPVLLPPLPGLVEGVLDRVDALLVAGGPDVDPSLYGQDRGPHTQTPVPDRDASELALLRRAMDDALPVLGICRGMQVLNVARGGTLVQHLPDLLGSDVHCPVEGEYGQHRVRVGAGTRLASALADGGTTDAELDVPTYHHQGVDRLGEGLVAGAWAADGVVEALEDADLPFCIGVQWHPEMGQDPALFRSLVAAGARRAASRT